MIQNRRTFLRYALMVAASTALVKTVSSTGVACVLEEEMVDIEMVYHYVGRDGKIIRTERTTMQMPAKFVELMRKHHYDPPKNIHVFGAHKRARELIHGHA